MGQLARLLQHTELQRIMRAGSQGGDLWAGTEFAGRVVTAVQPWPEVFGELRACTQASRHTCSS
jgi:hypothetical protein